MIDYDRGSWYGIHLLFRMRGSLLPRCVPAALLGACIAGGVELAEAYYDFDLDLGDKYSMQLFGLVFGYLSIARLNISYNRYWDVPMSLAAAQACVPPPSDGEAPPGSGDNPVRVWLLNGTAENTFQLSPAASPRRGGRLAQAREQVEAAEADPLPPRLAAEVAAEAEDDDDDMPGEEDYGVEP